MKHLSKVVNIIPVIAKADTMTLEEKSEFKQRVRRPLLLPSPSPTPQPSPPLGQASPLLHYYIPFPTFPPSSYRTIEEIGPTVSGDRGEEKLVHLPAASFPPSSLPLKTTEYITHTNLSTHSSMLGA